MPKKKKKPKTKKNHPKLKEKKEFQKEEVR